MRGAVRFVTHPLTLVVLAIAALYVLFSQLIDPPIPKSLLIQFMVFSTIGVFMVATFHDATCNRLFEPVRALLGAPGLRPWRMLALAIVCLGASTLAYAWIKPDLVAPPLELRSVHPAPPTSLRVYGQAYDMVSLRNPLRATARKGTDAYREVVAEGGELYYTNCLYCHGDHLNGQGQFASAFNPRPGNFQDVGTIAQLQESYLFWRIATGGPGLPREGAPWASAMPVWHEMLDEDEVWKVVTFLYDFTGFEPRSFELEDGGVPGDAGQPEASPAALSRNESIEAVYRTRCAQCHGVEGAGDGPAADFLYPRPRDFTIGLFKYKTTHADSEFPSDDDLRKTIREGLPGTSMPAWEEVLTDAQIDGLIGLIKEFGFWSEESEEELGIAPINMGARVESSSESIARGAALFTKACVQCHGEKGRGNVTSGKKLKDDWGDRIWPRNLTRPETWRWTRDATDIFQRISAGIRGTPMPEHTTTMSVQDRWNVANYVMTLRDAATPLSIGETVIRGVSIDGPLPGDPDDPAWARAHPIAFRLVPNIIKEERLFHSLNDTVTVRVLFNDDALAIRLDIDDRTYSVPGDEEEVRYRDEGVEPTPDAAAVQFPVEIPSTSEKPWFRHGDPAHPVNIWYWRAASMEPEAPERVMLFDASGPERPPVPRDDGVDLSGAGAWADGRWQVVLLRPLETDDLRDLRFETGRYIPIAFANWDGWAGQSGSRHTLTHWYWLLLEPEDRPFFVFGSSGAFGGLAGLLFAVAARHQRRRWCE
ncbi:MAG: c-type cytochrome [Alphaproteobacteria bacterium]